MKKCKTPVSENTNLPNLVLYGNLDGEEIIVINADEMKVHSIMPLKASTKPYAIDRVGMSNTLLTIARGDKLTEKIQINSSSNDYNLKHVCVQNLKHTPRTARGNSTGDKALISGGDVAMSTVLNLSCSCAEIELEVGDPESKKGEGATNGTDNGGSNASGHEFWIDANRFALLNRVKRQIHFYDQTLDMPEEPFKTFDFTTTPHHMLKDPQQPGRFYVSCEGSSSRYIPPSIFVLEEGSEGFELIGQMFLPVNPNDREKSGGHHLDQVGNLLIMGSAEGYAYIYDTRTLTLVAKLETGLGHGHTGFIPFGGKVYAVTINHKDIFTSIIEIDSLLKIGDIYVSDAYPEEESGRTKLAQGHTSFMQIRNGRPYFYLMVSHESKFLEIDILTKKISRTLDVKNDKKVICHGIDDLYMVQGTLISEMPDPMAGGVMGDMLNRNDRNEDQTKNSGITICTNCD